MGTHIDFVRSGGMGGLRMAASVDVDSLPPDAAAAVTQALAGVDLGAIGGRGGGPPSGPDRFQYDLTVDQNGRRQSVSLHEPDLPAELRPLINALLPLARYS